LVSNGDKRYRAFEQLEAALPITITDPEADTLARRLAEIEGVAVADAVLLAVREALRRRMPGETPLQTDLETVP
jgi:hypothetical protein